MQKNFSPNSLLELSDEPTGTKAEVPKNNYRGRKCDNWIETYLPRSNSDNSSPSVEVQSTKKQTVENMVFNHPSLADPIRKLVEVLKDMLNPVVYSKLEQNQSHTVNINGKRKMA